ncbi:hypothetical protein PTSG_04621 [Salpingoeca rosetta]|uniref:UBX domain-containing protein n=1 Tax=Salpingoeca rosetta (strain ATCC 50818 / BSB-021) TaxID=946362 RepID=F2U7Y7_SALR5|nr:uncharacterized protein PTSG_04621 [Salpingoeca rosetta]EGD72892.1 hypothetical protein PTSG_04621 [Salpingoeca rosetta]|eukprot:XP_004994714.1 hypothetical protein PTSG_04621 [Salpingoeca rosetta]
MDDFVKNVVLALVVGLLGAVLMFGRRRLRRWAHLEPIGSAQENPAVNDAAGRRRRAFTDVAHDIRSKAGERIERERQKKAAALKELQRQHRMDGQRLGSSLPDSERAFARERKNLERMAAIERHALREQQEEAYAASLAKDRAKQQRQQQADTAKRAVEGEPEQKQRTGAREKQQQQQQQGDVGAAQLSTRAAVPETEVEVEAEAEDEVLDVELPPEPEESDPNSILVRCRIRAVNGGKDTELTRRFAGTDTVQDLLNFVHTRGFSPRAYVFETAMPRVELNTRASSTIATAANTSARRILVRGAPRTI